MVRTLVVFAGLGWAGALAAGGLPTDISLTPAITGVPGPIAVRHAGDGSNRLFVASRDGSIRIKPATGAVLATKFLDLQANPPPHGFTPLAGEAGLLGLAFHPNYENNRQFYVSYSDAGGGNVVARYLAQAGNANVADPSSVQVVIRIAQDTLDHNGGDIHFGADGLLYIARGDGGDSNCNRSQTLRPSQLVNSGGVCAPNASFTGNPNSRALEGKMLRINVDATTPAGVNELCASAPDGSANYAIPAGNPFAGTAVTTGNCDEIWHYGLRNPFRFSFDRNTGDMYIGDVGSEGGNAVEEVNFAPSGAGGINFGWRDCEGTTPRTGTGCAGSIAPITGYTHTANGSPCSSITGGYRYRGSIASLQGTYVYSDYCTGRIQFATESVGVWTSQLWLNSTDLTHTSFGEDEAGELYLAEINGDRVQRFTSSVVDGIFQNGFE